MKTNLQWSGSSRQTEAGDSGLQPWDMLHSSISQYQFWCFRFSGCFSDVAECKDLDTKEITAIKIFKSMASGSQVLNRELAMLKRICGLDLVNIVRFFESFEHKGHICLAFEMLDKNLHEVLRERSGNSLSLQEIKPITQQLLSALESLKTVGVVYTHITPHNIMTVKQKDQALRVKLTDFGSAVAVNEVERGVTSQPIGYRSPEIILGLPISEAGDMWSLGGVLAAVYLGSLPFPQRCPYYLMKTLVETLGQPEDRLLNNGTNTLVYFSQSQDSTKLAWRLKTADENKAVTGFPPQIHRGSSTRFRCLNDLVMLCPEKGNDVDRIKFVSLLTMMLQLNPWKRITPSDALIHPFLTLSDVGDDDDRISQMMMVVGPESLSLVELTEELNTHASSIHIDEEPNNDDDDDTASDIVISVDGASAATESNSRDCAASCSGVNNVPAACLNAETSHGGNEVTTGMNEPVSAGDEFSQSTAGLSDDNASRDEALSQSAGGESNDATTGSADDDEAAVSHASTEPSTTSVTTVLYHVASADEGTDNTSSICEDTSSRNTQRKHLKRIRRVFSWMRRVLCCCFSVDVEE